MSHDLYIMINLHVFTIYYYINNVFNSIYTLVIYSILNNNNYISFIKLNYI